MKKICIACGMPMEKPEDFALSDVSKDYCRYCQRKDGSMQSYDEKLASYSQLLIKTQGLSLQAATAQVKLIMAGLPAWQNKTSKI